MAGRVKGITIDIEGNATPLQKALSDVDKSLRNTQKNLKDVDKLLKLDPKNVELLNQKHQLLGKAVADTKTKLDQLKKAQEQMDAKNVDKNSEEYQALQREIIATEQDLKKAQGALDAFEAEMAQASEETKKAKMSLKDFGDKAQDVSDKTRALSTGALALGTAFVGMAFNAGKTADDLLTMSRNTGISVEELQKMQYASDLVDVSMDSMTGSLSKLVKQMGSGSKVFEELGVSIVDENGNMRDATEVWYESLEALSKIENDTERDTIAMELFGKSAMDLSGIVDDGGASLKAFGQEAEDAGLILSTDAVQSAGEFNDELDKLKNTAQQAFFEAGATLAKTLIPMLESLVENVSAVLTWFGSLDGGTQTLILTILGLVASISPIAGLISSITTIIGALSVVTAPMAGMFLAIAGAIGVVIAIGVVLYENLDTIKEKASQLMEAMSTAWNNILNTITTVASNIWNTVSTTFNDIKTTISDAVSNAWSIVTDKFESIKTTISDKIESAKETVRSAIEAIKGFFDFQWSLPSIKLPHFSISGSKNPIDWITEGVPHISVDWYAKAQNVPYLFDTPTVIGVGDVPEVVVGADTFRRMTTSYNTPVTVNVYGNVQDYDAMARKVSERINYELTRKMRTY